MSSSSAVGTAVLLIITLVLSGCGSSAQPTNALAGQAALSQATGVLPVDDRPPPPSLQGPLLDGGEFDLATKRGQVVVINTWGSWCAPCRAEARALEQVYALTKASGVLFLGINVRDNRPAATAFQRTYNVSYPSLFDEDGTILARFRDLPPSAIPSTLVLDRQGRTAARFVGGLRVDDLLPVVRQVAAEPA